MQMPKTTMCGPTTVDWPMISSRHEGAADHDEDAPATGADTDH